MINNLIMEIAKPTPTRIVLVVIDGVGGLPHPETGNTELETANTPNLDRLAGRGVCGLIDPVGIGITPGSAPGHLALFGYDPVSCNIGRGVLEAIGIDFNLQPDDIAARGNFCTVDEAGLVTDRRAGRISNEKCAELCQLLDGLTIGETELIVRPVREHRFVAIFRGGKLSPEVSDSDPQQTGVMPKVITALEEVGRPLAVEKMADIANQFISRAKATLAEHHPARAGGLRRQRARDPPV